MSENLKNHLKISGAITVVFYIISSYIFGTFNHNDVSYDERVFSIIIFVLSQIIANGIYWESYNKDNSDNKDKFDFFD
jgi:hypothetical protein